MSHQNISNVLNDTYDYNLRNEYIELWDFLDYCIDSKLRSIINDNIELCFIAAKNYCNNRNISPIPPLYQLLFNNNNIEIYEEWCKRFPISLLNFKIGYLKYPSPVLIDFRNYLLLHYDKLENTISVAILEKFIEFHSM